jgi:IclR family pca regulon transcriptional regulator
MNAFQIHEVVFVTRFPGQHLININIDIVIGSRLPIFFTASGIAILSALPEEERLDLLKRTPLEPLTPFTVTDPDRLLERIRVAARQGYAAIMNETVMGDISVVAPLIDEHGRAVAGAGRSTHGAKRPFIGASRPIRSETGGGRCTPEGNRKPLRWCA